MSAAALEKENEEFWASVEALATRPSNLYNAFYWEVAWKNHSLRTGHFYLKALLNNEPEAKKICGEFAIEMANMVGTEIGRKPRIIDMGCGPVSSLAYLVHEDLAEVEGYDPLASDYEELLGRYGRRSPVPQFAAHGEYLEDVIRTKQFDIAHIRNALDHSQSPCVTWLNLFRLTSVGGYLIQSHSIREATKEQWRQLHQFDLFPDEAGHLWLQDSVATRVCLTEALPLAIVKKAVNFSSETSGWMTIVYRKLSDSWQNASYLAACMDQMQAAYRRRFNASLELERFVCQLLEEREPSKYPYKAVIDGKA